MSYCHCKETILESTRDITIDVNGRRVKLMYAVCKNCSGVMCYPVGDFIEVLRCASPEDLKVLEEKYRINREEFLRELMKCAS